ncbi:High mobility group protein 20A [Orbilia blumenaviensis]|uniref:High mobility group protein 20A n=1 Tax=Orbilia blumenaviensis TaxID=1796055 RepID=A0AAV9VQP2_9PEZI
MSTSGKSPDSGTKKSRQSHNNKVPPNAPRRNLSSFVIFANERRKELKELHPDRPYPAIQSDISAEWEKMDDNNKKKWRDAMEADKERYKMEMELYRKHGPGWAWVVGYQRRKELGLTTEDCTKVVEFISSTTSLEHDEPLESLEGRNIPEDEYTAQNNSQRQTKETIHHEYSTEGGSQRQTKETSHDCDSRENSQGRTKETIHHEYAMKGDSQRRTKETSHDEYKHSTKENSQSRTNPEDSVEDFNLASEPARFIASEGSNARDYYGNRDVLYNNPRPQNPATSNPFFATPMGNEVLSALESSIERAPVHNLLDPFLEEPLFSSGQTVSIFAPTMLEEFGFNIDEMPWDEEDGEQ